MGHGARQRPFGAGRILRTGTGSHDEQAANAERIHVCFFGCHGHFLDQLNPLVGPDTFQRLPSFTTSMESFSVPL